MDSYKVDLKDLESSAVSRHFSLGDDFFSAVQGSEIHQGNLDVALTVNETSGTYEVALQLRGTVRVECDRCLGMMNQDIEARESIKVRLGEQFEDDGEVITIPEKDGVLDLGWNIYEMAALAIPIRHVHPEEQCDPKVEAILSGEKDEEQAQQVDPRWAVLAKLKQND